MRRCEQLTAADWLAIDETPWGQLATFGPPSFEAYARLRYMSDPQWVGQRARENMQPLPHVTELDQVRRALRHLADYTATPDECFFCEWDGYGGDWLGDTVAGRGAYVKIPSRSPQRRYGLFAAPLSEIASWDELFGHALAPAFVWPADQQWCFASDVDPHWAGVGAERAAIDALIAASDIDVVVADPTEHQPHYS